MFFFRTSATPLLRTVAVAAGSVSCAVAQAPQLAAPAPLLSHPSSTTTTGLFSGSQTLLAPKRRPAPAKSTPKNKKNVGPKKSTPRRAKTKRTAATPTKTPQSRRHAADAVATATTPPPPPDSLASFHPAIAATWMAAASSKMLQPQHVTPRSRKLAWWLCPDCHAQFNKRIDLHVAAGGECPQCHVKPSLASTRGAAAGRASSVATDVKHRCRPNSALGTLAADNANRIKKSVADASYLRTVETRNLQPMLAKNYTNECAKIGEDEVVLVSPKLDGIRCVVSYDPKKKALLFFSRAGTLFECCDAKIEPTLRVLFENNPYLVLDGELYNDSVNIAKMRAAADGKKKHGGKKTFSAAVPAVSGDDASVLDFQALTSAIRTTRDRRTAEVEALQAKLQYHVFDVLYTSTPDGTSSMALSTTPYSARYALLQSLFRTLTSVSAAAAPASFDASVVRLVPSLPFLKSEIDDALESAIQYGYEGVMVRRETVGRVRRGGRHARSTRSAHGVGAFAQRLASARAALKKAAAAVDAQNVEAAVGYSYGQRSSSLLKYKRMQDAEYVIVGAVEGKGKWANSLGAFVCETKDGQHVFTVTPASTDAQKQQMWRHWQKEYKGKALTVQFQELTADGVPRFPVGKSVRGAASGSDWI